MVNGRLIARSPIAAALVSIAAILLLAFVTAQAKPPARLSMKYRCINNTCEERSSGVSEGECESACGPEDIISSLKAVTPVTSPLAPFKLETLSSGPHAVSHSPSLRRVPVIGIACEPTAGNDKPGLANMGTSFLAGSYVRWIESGGAQVVPLPFDLPKPQLQARLEQLNGLVFPGGGVSINDQAPYADFSRFVYNWAVKAQDMPVWGTCLGFEQLMVYSSSIPSGAGTTGILSEFDSEGLFLPLDFKSVAASSRLLGVAPATVIETLRTRNVTVNLHSQGISPAVVNNTLRATWQVLATNKDRAGKEFVSLAEAVTLPFYATQFHPEKNVYEFDQTWDNPGVAAEIHSSEAVAAATWMAQFFANQARTTNNRSFNSHAAFQNASIYNYAPVYTDKVLPGENLFETTYVFGGSA